MPLPKRPSQTRRILHNILRSNNLGRNCAIISGALEFPFEPFSMSQHIGSFEILDRLEAHSGHSSYLARSSEDGCSAIVDVWSNETTEAQTHFLERATKASRLDHQGIARVLDFGVDGSTSCTIEQSSDGKSLEAILREESPPTLASALAWLAQLARALEHAHEMGVVHGDVHPGLITIRSDRAVSLRGFANARPSAAVPYRAPESDDGAPLAVTADLYSFGALLRRLLATARHGATGDTARLDREPALLALVDACLAEDPELRPTGFAAVVDTLERALRSAGSAGSPDWASATVLADRSADEANNPRVDLPMRPVSDRPGRSPSKPDSGSEDACRSGRVSPAAGGTPSLDQVAAAIRRPSRPRWRHRWVTFAAVVGSAVWVVGLLWWSKGSPVEGSEAPAREASAVASLSQADDGSQADPPALLPPAKPPSEVSAPATTAESIDARTKERGTGRLALGPAWHPEITVAIGDGPPTPLDRRRVFEVEANIDHLLTFELATRDYVIREQIVTQVVANRLFETPVPVARPGTLSVGVRPGSTRRVFVRVGDEAIGWTPIRDLTLPVGVHTLSIFRNPTWRPEERIDLPVQVRARRETKVHVDLGEEPPALIVDGSRIEPSPLAEGADAAAYAGAP